MGHLSTGITDGTTFAQETHIFNYVTKEYIRRRMILMSIVDLMSVVSFGITCFELGIAYEKKHKKKK